MLVGIITIGVLILRGGIAQARATNEYEDRVAQVRLAPHGCSISVADTMKVRAETALRYLEEILALRFVAAGTGLGVAIQADVVAGDLVTGGSAAELAGAGYFNRADFVQRAEDALTHKA